MILRHLAALAIGALAFCSVVLAISWVASLADPSAVRQAVQSAVDGRGTVFHTDWLRDTTTGVDTFTDCLGVTIAAEPHRGMLAVLSDSAYLAFREHPCEPLQPPVADLTRPEVRVPYWRYWWGSAALARIAFGLWSVDPGSYRTILKVATYTVLVLLAGAMVARHRERALPLLPLWLAVMFAFGLPLFGQSIAHAPGLLIGLGIVLAYLAGGMPDRDPALRMGCAVLLGGVTTYLDLLNGNLLAVAIVFCAVQAIAMRPGPTGRVAASIPFAVLSLLAGFGVGTGFALAGRIAVRAIGHGQTVGSVVREWVAAFSVRTSRNWSEMQVEDFSGLYLVQRVYYKIDYAFFPYLGHEGALSVYAVCALLAAATLLAFVWRLRAMPGASFQRGMSLLLLAALVPLWFGLLPNHTAIHSWMTARLLSLMFGLVLGVGLLLARGERVVIPPARS